MKKMLLLSIALSISTTVIPKKILIVEGALYETYWTSHFTPIKQTNVTDKFFNRKNNTNWMNDTFGDPLQGTTKQLRIQYRKFDTKNLNDVLVNLQANSPKGTGYLVSPTFQLTLSEKKGIKSLIDNPDAILYETSSLTKKIFNPISYAIEKVEYGSKEKNKFFDVTDKFTSRANDTNWMNDTLGNPYPDEAKKLQVYYTVINEEDYNKLIQSELGKKTPLQVLELSERQGIVDGLQAFRPDITNVADALQ